MIDLRYPIGPCVLPSPITAADRSRWIEELAETPAWFYRAVAGLTAAQLETPYRPGGWTVRQVIHHVPDSHVHLYIRIKWALTETEPTIKPYDETMWAVLGDVRQVSCDVSLALLSALHERLVALLRTLSHDQFQRRFHHPEYDHPLTIEETIGRYVWHGRHHAAHITGLREREGW